MSKLSFWIELIILSGNVIPIKKWMEGNVNKINVSNLLNLLRLDVIFLVRG